MITAATPFNLSMHLQRCPPNPGFTVNVTPCAPAAPPPAAGLGFVEPSGTLKLGAFLFKLGIASLAVGSAAGVWSMVQPAQTRAGTVARVGLVGGAVVASVGLVAAQIGLITTGINAVTRAITPQQQP